MKAVLMAGGEGSRLRPLTVGRPKPMVPIVNKSVMAHSLALLKSHGINDVIVTLRYMASAIEDFFGDGSSLGMSLRYSVEDAPLGTAGSVRNASEFFDDTFLVISGDALTDINLTQAIDAHRRHGSLATLTLSRVENPLEYGVVISEGDGRIVQFLEKPGWDEIISDTVNTGIYILEPDVLKFIPPNTAYDFSTQLFPRLLKEELPIYGHVAEGYWCDVGNLDEYMRANADMLNGKVNLPEPIGTHLGGGIWVGNDVEIAPNAQLFGPIYLGNEVKIKGDVTINGPAVVRDYTVVDGHNRIERSLIWRNCYIGESCELRGAVVSRQCSVKSHVSIFEGAIVGDNCTLGEGSVLHAGVKIWPRKEIEPGGVIRNSVIWGSSGRRVLFNRFGVSGIVNVDLTPEFAAKLSAALGATLQKGTYVAVNRDIHRTSRMLKRALISGLPSTGIHVWDVGTVAIPVMRHFVHTRDNTSAGIHVRLSPFDQRVVDIRFIDSNGLNNSQSAERSIERAFFREDFRRAYLDEIGIIDYAPETIQRYTRDFLRFINVDRIQDANFHVVVDYSHGLAADTLSDIMTRLSVDVVPLNARMNESKLAMLRNEFEDNHLRMGKIVAALGADVGVQLDVGGEKIFLVDERGCVMDDMHAALLMIELALHANRGRSIAVPVDLPNAFDTVAGWHGSTVRRVRNSPHSMMAAAMNGDELLIADGTGNFIFPDFHPAIDGMMATVRLLEYLAARGLTLSQVLDYLPSIYMASSEVNCAWNSKGKVMRILNERFRGCNVEKIDGLKVHLTEHEWVHLTPSSEKPLFTVRAEAQSTDRARALVAEYTEQITDIAGSGEG